MDGRDNPGLPAGYIKGVRAKAAGPLRYLASVGADLGASRAVADAVGLGCVQSLSDSRVGIRKWVWVRFLDRGTA